jgi:glycosyltransferase involved in cell wall biosynthesis
MKIGFDAKRAFHNKTGLGNYSRSFIKALIDTNSNSDLYLFTSDLGELGFEFIHKPKVHIIQPKKRIHQFLPAYWRSHGLLDDVKKEKIKVFHGLSNELPVGIERVNVKSVVTIHDLIFLRFPELYPPIDRRIYERKFKSAVERADKIFACSIQTANDIKEFYHIENEKIEVVYQDCASIFKQVISDHQKFTFLQKYLIPSRYILSVGTLEKRKNQLNVLKAFKLASLNDTSLIFLGKKSDLYPEIVQFIKAERMHDKVIFLDKIEEEELPLLYQSAMAFVYFSRFEGFGIPILEAMRSGIPVLSSNVSSLPEVAGEAALYAAPDDVIQLSKNMIEISGNPEIRLELIKKGFEQATNFDSDKIAKQVINLYKELAGEVI